MENVFYYILEGKDAFLGYKKIEVQKVKKLRFFKGVIPWFWSKNGHFSIFLFLGNKGLENVSYASLERKNFFQGYKSKKFKKSKSWDFSKGVNPWFWSKIVHFSTAFLSIIGQENVLYDILERKNAFRGYKNKKFKHLESWDFSKEVNAWFWSKIAHFFFWGGGNIGQENVFYDIV